MFTATNKMSMHSEGCQVAIRAVRDALEALSGRWKMLVLLSLMFGSKRFKQIAKDLDGITDRVLSKELKELEMHQLIRRTVVGGYPQTVEYSVTEHGQSLKELISTLKSWGMEHREKIIGKKVAA